MACYKVSPYLVFALITLPYWKEEEGHKCRLHAQMNPCGEDGVGVRVGGGE